MTEITAPKSPVTTAEFADGIREQLKYSQGVTVEQDYVLRIPDSIPFEKAAPLLCAGITTYAPLKRWGAGPGKNAFSLASLSSSNWRAKNIRDERRSKMKHLHILPL